MNSIDKSIDNTAKRYGDRIAMLAPDPDELERCPICGNDFIVAELFPNAQTRSEIADSVERSIKLQMRRIVSEAQQDIDGMHETMAGLSDSIESLQESNQEISEERDAAVQRFLDAAPSISCLKEIMTSVKKTRLNVEAVMKSFRPNEANSDEYLTTLQKLVTIQGDTIDQIHNLIIDTFATDA